MDIDWYIARNQPTWDRLAELTRRGPAPGRPTSTRPSSTSCCQLYQRTSAQLSYARTYFRDPALTARLTRLVADASGVIYGKRARSIAGGPHLLRRDLPGRGVGLAPVHPASACRCSCSCPPSLLGAWLLHDPRALDASASPAQRQAYVQDQFEQYYSDQPHAQFFTEVTINNILVSFIAFAGGRRVLRVRRPTSW